jgi:rhodanese-related sulfurtransferase
MQGAATGVVDLSRDDVKRGLAEGTITLVDVREPHEFAAGHIPGAVSVPLSTFDVEALPDAERIVFSCNSGVRSVRAIEFARASGRDIHEHYKGGFKDWLQAGEPVE